MTEELENQRTKMWELGYSHGFLNLSKQEKIRLPEHKLDYEDGFENGVYDLKLATEKRNSRKQKP